MISDRSVSSSAKCCCKLFGLLGACFYMLLFVAVSFYPNSMSPMAALASGTLSFGNYNLLFGMS